MRTKRLRAFIINLERSKDRKEAMQAQISKLFAAQPALEERLEFSFFRGVDASAGEHEAYAAHFPKWLRFLGMALSEGEKGCYASHFRLWSECVRADECVFVFEDDVEFSPAFLAQGAQMLEKIIASPYEYVRLFYIFERKSYALGENFILTFGDVNGTQGYFLRPSAAKKFIKASKFWLRAVDNAMDMSHQNKVLNVIFKPLLLSCENQTSLIAQRGERIRGYGKLMREILRIYFQGKKFVWVVCVRIKLQIKETLG